MRKLSHEDVKLKFESKGWRLVSTEYTGSQVPLDVVCPDGHSTTIMWNNFQRGQGCKLCAGNEKFSYDQVKEYYQQQGCELLETEYVNSVTEMHFRCSCGRISKCSLGNFRQGRRCQKCKGVKASENLRKKNEELSEFCKNNECQFIRSWLENKRTRIEYVCKCGRVSEAYWTNFRKFPNCWECGKAKKSGSNCYMYDPDREAVEMRKKFRKMCGQHILRFMKATGQKKTKHTHELLGYRPSDLQEHILNHPDYKLCIGKEWHVDHYFPIQAFLDHGILDLKVINRLDNLRPIPGPENLQKADKYDEKEFTEWLNQEYR